MTLEEALNAAVADTYSDDANNKIIINNDLRTMNIPSDTVLGVESDENVNKLNFQMPRFYCGTDLSEFNIYVNYTNGRTKDAYIVFNQTVNEDSIDFTWVVSRTAVTTKGTTKFIVCLKKSDDSGNIIKEYNTTVHELTVLEGLETVSQDISEYSDTIEQLLLRISTLNNTAEENLKSTQQYAQNASTDAQQAKQSAESASTSAQNAAKYEQSASTSKTEAETAKQESATSAKEAKESAASALESKNEIDKIKSDIEEAAKGENVSQIQRNMKDIGQLQTDISDLQDKKITKFYANSLGDTHLTDSDNGKIMDMKLYGKSEQKQYTGRNLLNLRDGNKTVLGGGVTYTRNDDGSYKRSGTATDPTGNVWIKGQWNIAPKDDLSNVIIKLKKNKTYYIKDCVLFSGSTNIDVRRETNDCITTLQEDFLVTGIRNSGFEVGTTYNDTMYPMVVESSTSVDFEPYVGGIPSPNPDYPQEIKSVVKPGVKIVGKNLFECNDYDNTTNGVRILGSSESGKVFLNGTTTKMTDVYIASLNRISTPELNAIKDKKVTLSNNLGYVNYFFDKTNQTYPKNSIKAENIGFAFIRIPAGETFDNTELKIQLEIGEEATEYQIYKEQTISLPYTLNAIPTKSGGNVTIDGQQYIADYVDFERGKLVRNVREVDFSTCDNDGYNNFLDVSKEVRYRYDVLKIKQKQINCGYDHGGGIINTFTIIEDTTWNKDRTGIASHAQGDGNNISLRIPLDADVNTYFNEIGGCKGLFEIDTPEEIELTAEEIKVFKELVTYYPATNISVTSDQLDGYTTFNYPISMKNGWDYVKQQLNDNRDYIYDMDAKTQDIDTQSAEAYVNSEYAVALTELEVM